MKLYLSELDLPEFQAVPVQEARRIWRECLWNDSTAINARLLVFIPTIILLAWFDMPAPLAGLFMVIAFELSQFVLIARMRPVIREAVQAERGKD